MDDVSPEIKSRVKYICQETGGKVVWYGPTEQLPTVRRKETPISDLSPQFRRIFNRRKEISTRNGDINDNKKTG